MRKLEIQDLVDQQAHPALVLLAARPELFAQQGSISTSWRRRGAKTYGPYYRLRYRDGSRSCSLYLGRGGPVVDRVRHALHALQSPLRRRRAFAQLRRQVREPCGSTAARSTPVRTSRPPSEGFRGPRTAHQPARRTLTRVRQRAEPPDRLLADQAVATAPCASASFRVRGGAAKWARENRPKIPRLPQARLQAFLDARDAGLVISART